MNKCCSDLLWQICSPVLRPGRSVDNFPRDGCKEMYGNDT